VAAPTDSADSAAAADGADALPPGRSASGERSQADDDSDGVDGANKDSKDSKGIDIGGARDRGSIKGDDNSDESDGTRHRRERQRSRRRGEERGRRRRRRRESDDDSRSPSRARSRSRSRARSRGRCRDRSRRRDRRGRRRSRDASFLREEAGRRAKQQRHHSPARDRSGVSAVDSRANARILRQNLASHGANLFAKKMADDFTPPMGNCRLPSWDSVPVTPACGDDDLGTHGCKNASTSEVSEEGNSRQGP
jgi:hypothetical protein